MISGFSRKKIKSVRTLGERLKKARLSKNISLEDAEIGSKVKSQYLLAIEKGKWADLPQNVYTRGFVLAYAKFLNLNLEKIKDQYQSEMAFLENSNRKETARISYNQSIKESKVLVTPKLLAYCALGAFVLAMFSYIIVQLSGFTGTPNLLVTSPSNNSVIEEDSIDIAGVTDVDAFVKVNDENVPVSSDGRFIKKLKLHRGVNVLEVKAQNKTKKESVTVYTVEYKPKTASVNQNLNQ